MAFFAPLWPFQKIIQCHHPKCVSRVTFATPMSMPMGACVFQYFIHPVMIRWVMRVRPKDGAPFKMLKKFYYQSCQCWPSRIVNQVWTKKIFEGWKLKKKFFSRQCRRGETVAWRAERFSPSRPSIGHRLAVYLNKIKLFFSLCNFRKILILIGVI